MSLGINTSTTILGSFIAVSSAIESLASQNEVTYPGLNESSNSVQMSNEVIETVPRDFYLQSG
jgi:hypothetical protein